MSLARTLLIAATISAAFAAAPGVAQESLCSRLSDRSLVAPGPERVPGTVAHVYREVDGTVLRLHILRPPAGTASGAAVVAMSVGGWMFGNVASFMPNAERLAARGLTVVMPDIRNYCRDGANIVDEVADAKAAVRWVRAHASDLGIDPDRIAAAGGSAGGHLALSTAMFPAIDAAAERTTRSRPDLLLLFFPCVDPTSEIEQEFSGPAIGEHGAEVSPLLHLGGGLPPMIVLQGTDDPLFDSVNAFCMQANARGNSCTYREYGGAKHGFFRPGNEAYEPAMADLVAFLDRAGFTAPSAS